MKKLILVSLVAWASMEDTAAQSFSPGNLVVLQTNGIVSKASSSITLAEYSTSGTAGISITLPTTGSRAIQTAGVYGGSEGFLTTATDGKYLLLGGYATPATFTDITGTTAASVTRVVGTVAPSGFYLPVASSNTFYSANDIRGAVSDGTNYWASGASVASVDGINYFGPSTPLALGTGATPPKAYGLRIFNGQLYYSTQKAGPSNTASQLGIFAIGTGLPTSGTVSPTQIINTGTVIPQDFSFNATGDICYIAISLNTSAGGIQKWTKSGATWSLAYTLGTGVSSIGAYGLVVDYSGTYPTLYATTFETTGNRVIKIVDNGSSATATTIVSAVTNVFNKGISFAPVASGTPVVNLSISADTASEAATSVITVTANASTVLSSSQTVSIAVSGLGITAGDYALSSATITIPAGATKASVTFTVKDDILGEGTEIANINMSSPSSGIVLGTLTTQSITIADNDGNNPPTITIDSSTTNFIDGGLSTILPSPFKISAANSDRTDPASLWGVNFYLNDLETPDTSLTLKITTSNTTVVPLSSLILSGKGAIRNLKIVPKSIGYSDITLTVSDGKDSTKYILNYAASAASNTPFATYWHTGMSDGSDAIALDDNYYISGDDEMNILNVYSRNSSGLPVASYNFTAGLALPEPSKPEVDLEAATASPVNANRIYWMGSMSNGKLPFDNKPNRDRIFANTVTGTGAATTFNFIGFASLRNSIITWGDANGYNFTASAAAGVDSKLLNGFAAEGMVFAPNNTTLYIGLRAPLVPVTARNKALIVPIKNFETWFNNGAPSGTPTFEAPIELDLGGRGIRDLIKLPNGTYIIAAGNVGSSPVTAALYKWTGKQTDTPILFSSPACDTLNVEGVMPVYTGSVLSLNNLQVITDKGSDVLYNDGVEAKDFNDLIYRKFRSDILSSLDLAMPTPTAIKESLSKNETSVVVYPNPSKDLFNIEYKSDAKEAVLLTINDLSGRIVYQSNFVSEPGQNKLMIKTQSFAEGMYLLNISSASMNLNQKLFVK